MNTTQVDFEPAYYVPNNNNNDTEHATKKKMRCMTSIYMITHMIIGFFAIYLSWKCNRGFNLLHFILAFFCPYLYIIWALATRGGCGVFEDASMNVYSPIRPLSP